MGPTSESLGFRISLGRGVFACSVVFLLLIVLFYFISSRKSSSSTSSEYFLFPSFSKKFVSSPSPSSSSRDTFVRPPPNEQVDIYPLFPLANHPLDSTGEVYDIQRNPARPGDDYLSYPFCSFTHVCLTPSSIIFRWHDPSIYLLYADEVKNCKNPNRVKKNVKYDLCFCFYIPELQPDVLPLDKIHANPIEQTISISLKQQQHKMGHGYGITNRIKKRLTPSSFSGEVDSSLSDNTNGNSNSSISSNNWYSRPGRHLRSTKSWGPDFNSPLPASQFVEFLPPTSYTNIFQSYPTTSLNSLRTTEDYGARNVDSNSEDFASRSSFSPSPLPPPPLPFSHTPSILPGHYWSVHKYARAHHIGHWTQRIMLFSSIFQHASAFPLPPIDAFVLQDTDQPIPSHFMAIFNISLYSLLTHQPHNFDNLLYPSLEEAQAWPNQFLTATQLTTASDVGNYTCMERVSYARGFGIFSTNNHDTMAFRAVAYKQYGLSGLAHRCPPRRITLLTRDNRKILNSNEIVTWIESTYGKKVDIASIGGGSSPREQIELFANSGLLLASHSSQLVNVMFSHPRASIIEIAPEYYNSDFSEYAHGMGVYFQYALGGSVPGHTIDQSMINCLERLNKCFGDSYCILNKRFENVCKRRATCCKYEDGFMADIEQVKAAVKRSIAHLNWACGENW